MIPRDRRDLLALAIGDGRIAQAPAIIAPGQRGVGMAVLGAVAGRDDLVGEVRLGRAQRVVGDEDDGRAGLGLQRLALGQELGLAIREGERVAAGLAKAHRVAHRLPFAVPGQRVGHEFDALDLEAERAGIDARRALAEIAPVEDDGTHPAGRHLQGRGAAHDAAADDGDVVGLAHACRIACPVAGPLTAAPAWGWAVRHRRRRLPWPTGARGAAAGGRSAAARPPRRALPRPR